MANLKDYVNYLNSLHNANAANENTIAENQIKNDYYDEIKINRDIGDILYKKLISENMLLILTGHAGDGKTSILSQFISKNESKIVLDKSGYFSARNKKIFYIKDFSEYNSSEQYSMLEKACDESKESSSILISNVGPLIENLKKLYSKNSIDLDDAEDEILNIIDHGKGEFLNFNGIKTNIFLVNIARINNISFIGNFIDKILNPSLWDDQNYENNIIYKNFKICYEKKERLKKLVERFYIWQYEHNERSTIRQIVAHIAYSLTGNYSLENSEEPDFLNNNFAHYFFGYKNNKLDLEAQQIDSIRKISELKLDERKISDEYKYFVQENYENLPTELSSKYKNYTLDEICQTQRKNIRRNIIFWGDNMSDILNLYGELFNEYLDIKKTLNISYNLQTKVFKGISRLLTGMPLEEKNKRDIYITLKREGNFIQNIQLIRGRIDSRDIKLLLEKENNNISNDEYDLYLTLGHKKDKMKISYPLLHHLIELEKGCVKTSIDPHLSNGIENLKTRLIENNKDETSSNEFSVLVSTNKGSSVYDFFLSDGKITIR